MEGDNDFGEIHSTPTEADRPPAIPAAHHAIAPRLRVAYLIDHLGPGGAEALTALYLPRLRALGVEPQVLSFNELGGTRLIDEIRSQGIPVEVLGIERMSDPRALPMVLSRLRRGRADLIHAQLELSELVGPTAARILRIPSVVTLHTVGQTPVTRKGRARARVVNLALRSLPDRVIAVSEDAARHYVEVNGLPSARVATVHNGIALDAFRPAGPTEEARGAVRAELGIPQDSLLVTTVAVLREPKGIQHLIRALPLVAREAPRAHCLLVGDGEHRQALLELCRREGVEERVHFVGMRGDVAHLLHASDLFVLPSLNEALPTVIAEAMAAGVPIVATMVGGIPEMVDDGTSGLLVAPGDSEALAAACARVLGDPGLSARMAAAGSRMVGERFDLDRQARRLRAIYAELSTGRGRA